MTDEATLRGWLVDDFSQHVLTGALRVVGDRENPLRLNLFAAAVRELFGHTLHTLAPDTEVTQCSWYAPEPNTNRPTRRQRVKYATQGGLSDAFIAEVGVDVNHLHDDAIASINELSKYTHVGPGVLVTDQSEIESTALSTRPFQRCSGSLSRSRSVGTRCCGRSTTISIR